jgi:hypothetical protein
MKGARLLLACMFAGEEIPGNGVAPQLSVVNTPRSVYVVVQWREDRFPKPLQSSFGVGKKAVAYRLSHDAIFPDTFVKSRAAQSCTSAARLPAIPFPSIHSTMSRICCVPTAPPKNIQDTNPSLQGQISCVETPPRNRRIPERRTMRWLYSQYGN